MNMKYVFLMYFILSVITFIIYAIDKRAAQHNARRVPERTLHQLAIWGGWPGALLAQKVLRHKSAKQAFLNIFWITVCINLLALVAVGWILKLPAQ